MRVVLQTLQASALYMKLLLESQLKVIKLSHILKNLGSEREREREREKEREREIAYNWLVILHNDAENDQYYIT